jgi:hypothetical protein
MAASPRNPARAFAIVCVACALGVGAYFAWTRQSAPGPVERTDPAAPIVQPEPSSAAPARAPTPRQMLFRYTGVDANYGKLASVREPDFAQPGFVPDMACEVVHFAAGRGICLTAERGVLTTYHAILFDSRFARQQTIALPGVPSRCRVAPDGSLAAVTVFLAGHGYTSVDLSTQTLLIDTSTGRVLADLETFEITRDGRRFAAKDFNFWGVTFLPDSRGFYCTLATGGRQYLVKGDVASRSGSVVHENVECPSLSPDGLRIAYKKRFIVGGRIVWQLHVLDVATMRETPLAEQRSVDDQLEWLDNDHVLYAVSRHPDGTGAETDVWRTDVTGAAPPARLLANAYSPAVVR